MPEDKSNDQIETENMIKAIWEQMMIELMKDGKTREEAEQILNEIY